MKSLNITMRLIIATGLLAAVACADRSGGFRAMDLKKRIETDRATFQKTGVKSKLLQEFEVIQARKQAQIEADICKKTGVCREEVEGARGLVGATGSTGVTGSMRAVGATGATAATGALPEDERALSEFARVVGTAAERSRSLQAGGQGAAAAQEAQNLLARQEMFNKILTLATASKAGDYLKAVSIVRSVEPVKSGADAKFNLHVQAFIKMGGQDLFVNGIGELSSKDQITDARLASFLVQRVADSEGYLVEGAERKIAFYAGCAAGDVTCSKITLVVSAVDGSTEVAAIVGFDLGADGKMKIVGTSVGGGLKSFTEATRETSADRAAIAELARREQAAADAAKINPGATRGLARPADGASSAGAASGEVRGTQTVVVTGKRMTPAEKAATPALPPVSSLKGFMKSEDSAKLFGPAPKLLLEIPAAKPVEFLIVNPPAAAPVAPRAASAAQPAASVAAPAASSSSSGASAVKAQVAASTPAAAASKPAAQGIQIRVIPKGPAPAKEAAL